MNTPMVIREATGTPLVLEGTEYTITSPFITLGDSHTSFTTEKDGDRYLFTMKRIEGELHVRQAQGHDGDHAHR